MTDSRYTLRHPKFSQATSALSSHVVPTDRAAVGEPGPVVVANDLLLLDILLIFGALLLPFPLLVVGALLLPFPCPLLVDGALLLPFPLPLGDLEALEVGAAVGEIGVVTGLDVIIFFFFFIISFFLLFFWRIRCWWACHSSSLSAPAYRLRICSCFSARTSARVAKRAIVTTQNRIILIHSLLFCEHLDEF